MYPRHNGSSSVLFCDGHVTRLSDPGIRVEQKRNYFDPLADVNGTDTETTDTPSDPLAPEIAASPSPKAPAK
jgi:prepilin-type processing-associated H-X9-DG protein